VGSTRLANPLSAWWPLGRQLRHDAASPVASTAHRLPGGLTRSGASLIALAIVAAACALVLLRAIRRRSTPDALALLCLLGLARCVGDLGKGGSWAS
jgi:hypothetical protein